MSRVRKINGEWITIAGSSGSGDAGFWEGTLEEFEEQKDSIPDGTLLNIIDDKEAIGDIDALVDAINGEDVAFIPEVYDETERVIGTWFGKPLYRKTYHTQTSSDSFGNVFFGDLIGLNVHKIYGIVDNRFTINHSYFVLDSATNQAILSNSVLCWVSNDREKLVLRVTGPNTNLDAYVTIEYTKEGD